MAVGIRPIRNRPPVRYRSSSSTPAGLPVIITRHLPAGKSVKRFPDNQYAARRRIQP